MKTETENAQHVPSAPRLSHDLEILLESADGKDISLADVERVLHGRGFTVLILVITLPFTLPIVPLGLSVPFGAAIALLGVRMMFGYRPWLPEFILNKKIPHAFLVQTLKLGIRWSKRMERVIQPRMRFMEWPGFSVLIGGGIVLGGLIMSLPLPLPFSNMLPAIATVLLILGNMERDGAVILAGIVVMAFSVAYIALSCRAAQLVVESVLGRFF